MRKWAVSGLHLLATSRDETDIRDFLHDNLHIQQNEVISMKNEFVDKDIASFISDYLKDNLTLCKWKEHHDQIGRALIERSEGVCVLRLLSKEFY